MAGREAAVAAALLGFSQLVAAGDLDQCWAKGRAGAGGAVQAPGSLGTTCGRWRPLAWVAPAEAEERQVDAANAAALHERWHMWCTDEWAMGGLCRWLRQPAPAPPAVAPAEHASAGILAALRAQEAYKGGLWNQPAAQGEVTAR